MEALKSILPLTQPFELKGKLTFTQVLICAGRLAEQFNSALFLQLMLKKDMNHVAAHGCYAFILKV